MKKLILICALMLTACASQKSIVAVKFPNVPVDLVEACPDLRQVDPTTNKLSDVLPIVADNYNQYYECKNKVDGWIEWYNTQKNISDNVK